MVEYFIKELDTWRGEKGRRIARLEKSRGDLEQQLNGKLKHMQGLISGDATKGETFKQKLRMSEYVDALRQRAAARAGLANAQGILKAAQAKVAQHESNPPPMPVDDLSPAVERAEEVRYKEMVVNRLGRDMAAIRSQSASLAGTKYYEIEARYRTEKAALEALRPQIKAKIETEYRAALKAQLVVVVDRAQDEVRRLEALTQTTEQQVGEFKEFKDLDETDNAKLVERIPEDDAITRYRGQISDIDRAIIHMRADLDAPVAGADLAQGRGADQEGHPQAGGHFRGGRARRAGPGWRPDFGLRAPAEAGLRPDRFGVQDEGAAARLSAGLRRPGVGEDGRDRPGRPGVLRGGGQGQGGALPAAAAAKDAGPARNQCRPRRGQIGRRLAPGPEPGPVGPADALHRRQPAKSRFAQSFRHCFAPRPERAGPRRTAGAGSDPADGPGQPLVHRRRRLRRLRPGRPSTRTDCGSCSTGPGAISITS